MNTVKDIFKSQGYDYRKDGRNWAHRSLQSLLDTGIITFRVCEKGMVWTTKAGFKYNVGVSITRPDGGYHNTFFKSPVTNKNAHDILMLVGKVLQKPEVRSFLKSYVDVDCTCQKCGGAGYIPQFRHYCDGVCFACFGLGYDRNFKPVVELQQ